MVQDASRQRNGADDYWKLDSYAFKGSAELTKLLEDRGHTPKARGLEKLLDQLSCLDRGFVHYEYCTSDELQCFALARGTTEGPTFYGDFEDDKTLSRRIKDGDDNATFRFGDLPPELRLHVYEWYYHGITGFLEAPGQPPIRQVSRLFRRESLPLFYKSFNNFTFRLSVKYSAKDENPGASTVIERCTADLMPVSKRFWAQLPLEHLQRVRRLRIEECQSDDQGFAFDVDLGAESSEAKVTNAGSNGRYTASSRIEIYHDTLRRFAKRVARRSADGALQRSDIEEILYRLTYPHLAYEQDERDEEEVETGMAREGGKNENDQ